MSSWKTVKLGDVCEFKPKKARAKQLLDGKDLISFAPMELLPINQKYFTSTEERSLDSVYPSYTYFEENDVIYAKITPCFENGKLSIAKNLKNGVGFGSSEFVPIRCSDRILPEYLYYFLLNPSFIKNGTPKMIGASGHRRVPNEYTENLEIELPSLEEQWRIVARLDTAFEKISAAEVLTRQNLDNVSALQKSILQKYLSASGTTHRLGDICAILGGKRLPKGEKLLSTPTPHPYVRVTDFDGKGGVDTNDIRYISDSVYEKISRYIINAKDVFLSIAGTIGVTGIVPEMLDGANLTENACRLVPSDAINTRYLYYFTTSEIFRVQALAETKQTAQPKLALMRIKDIQIDLPSIEEQESIVMKLDNVLGKTQRAEAQYQKKLAKLTDLRQSLLAEAFSTTNTV